MDGLKPSIILNICFFYTVTKLVLIPKASTSIGEIFFKITHETLVCSLAISQTCSWLEASKIPLVEYNFSISIAG